MAFAEMKILEQFVKQAAEILAGRNAADRAGEDVVEHQGGDGEFGEAAAEGLLDGAIDAATNEHAATFDVHRANGVREEHDCENEPRRGLANVALGLATGVVSGRGEVVE